MGSISPLLRADVRASALPVAGYLAALVLILGGTVAALGMGPLDLWQTPKSRPDWFVVGRPYPAFDLTADKLDEADRRYTILRNRVGDGRRDVMSWDESPVFGPRVMFDIYRPGTELPQFQAATDAIADRLPAFATVQPEGRMTTKFGTVSLVAVEMKSATDLRRCLAFTRAYRDPRLQLSGWSCRDDGQRVEAIALACPIDRLTLLSAASEPKIGALFARAELRRTFCAKPQVQEAARIPGWRDAGVESELRLRLHE